MASDFDLTHANSKLAYYLEYILCIQNFNLRLHAFDLTYEFFGHLYLCQGLWVFSDPCSSQSAAALVLLSATEVEPIHMTGMCHRSSAHKASKELFYRALIVLEGVLRACVFLQ